MPILLWDLDLCTAYIRYCKKQLDLTVTSVWPPWFWPSRADTAARHSSSQSQQSRIDPLWCKLSPVLIGPFSITLISQLCPIERIAMPINATLHIKTQQMGCYNWNESFSHLLGVSNWLMNIYGPRPNIHRVLECALRNNEFRHGSLLPQKRGLWAFNKGASLQNWWLVHLVDIKPKSDLGCLCVIGSRIQVPDKDYCQICEETKSPSDLARLTNTSVEAHRGKWRKPDTTFACI